MTKETTPSEELKPPIRNLYLLGLAKDFLAPTAIIAGIAYYIGWSIQATYYRWYGLSPSFMSKPFYEILAAAWVELFLMVGGLLLAFTLARLVGGWMTSSAAMAPTFWERMTIRFIPLLILLFGLAGVSLFLLLTRQMDALTLGVITAVLAVLWLVILIGHRIEAAIREKSQKTKLDLLFRVFFPSALLYTTLLLLVIVFMLSRVGSWHGTLIAANQISKPDAALQGAVLYSRQPLPLPGGLDTNTDLYTYQNLKLIDATDRYLYLVQFSNSAASSVVTPAFRTYVVPRTDGLILETHRPAGR